MLPQNADDLLFRKPIALHVHPRPVMDSTTMGEIAGLMSETMKLSLSGLTLVLALEAAAARAATTWSWWTALPAKAQPLY